MAVTSGRERPPWRLLWPTCAPARERCIRRPGFLHVGAATDGAKTLRPRQNPWRDAKDPVASGRQMAKVELIPADLSLNGPIIAIDPGGELARNVIDWVDRQSLPIKRTLAPRLRYGNVAGQPTP